MQHGGFMKALMPQFSVIIGMISLSLLFASIAYAENEATCKAYATEAVNQYNQAKAKNCPSIEGPRWQGNYNNHHTWCLGAPSEDVTNEGSRRSSLLKLCQGDPIAKQCDIYAKMAMAQIAEAKQLRCAVSLEPRWTATYDNHLNWCIQNQAAAAETETKVRDSTLDQCKNPHKDNSGTPSGSASGQAPGQGQNDRSHCAADCDVCTREGLKCTNGGQCQEKYPTTAVWLCY